MLWGKEQVVTAFRRLEALDRSWEWDNGEPLDFEACCSEVFVAGSRLRPNRRDRKQYGSIFQRAVVNMGGAY